MGPNHPIVRSKSIHSMIARYLSLEARIEIEMLAKRHDMNNNAKHEDLLKILDKYVPDEYNRLGSGTNRYAVRLGGYVFKFATDNDGKIDNFKEFKMADRLYPYVANTYEVSENGTILVAEYVQPFTALSEMLQYSGAIRRILKKISSQYLIGDVGISSKNYANWGTRVGTDDPVCLDFAYVYRVNSGLFVCRKCREKAMLRPTDDYVRLICPACNETTEFIEIREMIGNDVHNHEIGDLSEESYRVTEPVTVVHLDVKRSRYLAYKKSTDVEEDVTASFVDTDIGSDKDTEPISVNTPTETEESSMKDRIDLAVEFSRDLYKSRNPFLKDAVLATSSGLNAHNDYADDDDPPISINGNASATSGKKPVAQVVQFDDDEGEDDSMSAAFVDVDAEDDDDDDDEDVVTLGEILDAIEAEDDEDEDDEEEQTFIDVEVDDEDDDPPIPINTKPSPPKRVSAEVVNTTRPVHNKPVKPAVGHRFSRSFINNGQRAISKFIDRMIRSFAEVEMYENVKDYCNRPNYRNADDLYDRLKRQIFIALSRYFDLERYKGDNGKTYYRFRADDLRGTPYESSLIFLDRLWMDPNKYNECEQYHLIDQLYCKHYNDHLGLQPEAIDAIRDILEEDLVVSQEGIDDIIDTIESIWGQAQFDEPKVYREDKMEDDDDEDDDEGDLDNIITQGILEHGFRILPFINEDVIDRLDIDEDDELIGMTVNMYPIPDGKGNEVEGQYLVMISTHIFTVVEQYRLRIPLVFDIRDIDPALYMNPHSMIDDRNGMWDWLAHFPPTSTVCVDESRIDEFMQYNVYGKNITIILDENDDGTYLLGVYQMAGVFIRTGDDDDEIAYDDWRRLLLNYVITANIGTGLTSMYKHVLDFWFTYQDSNDPDVTLNRIKEMAEEEIEEMEANGIEYPARSVSNLSDVQSAAEAAVTRGMTASFVDATVEGPVDAPEVIKEVTEDVQKKPEEIIKADPPEAAEPETSDDEVDADVHDRPNISVVMEDEDDDEEEVDDKLEPIEVVPQAPTPVPEPQPVVEQPSASTEPEDGLLPNLPPVHSTRRRYED